MGTFASAPRPCRPLSSIIATLGAARQISPLIRAGRYAALITGFFYGKAHLQTLTKQEEGIQEHENKLRAARDARLKAEKDANAALEMNALGKECGVSPA